MAHRHLRVLAFVALVGSLTVGVFPGAPVAGLGPSTADAPPEIADGATFTVRTESIVPAPSGRICASRHSETVNRVTITDATLHNVTVWHEGELPTRLSIPSADTDRTVLYTNGENALVSSLAALDACLVVPQPVPVTLEAYYMDTSTLDAAGMRLRASSTAAEDVPEPGGLALDTLVTDANTVPNNGTGGATTPTTSTPAETGTSSPSTTTTPGAGSTATPPGASAPTPTPTVEPIPDEDTTPRPADAAATSTPTSPATPGPSPTPERTVDTPSPDVSATVSSTPVPSPNSSSTPRPTVTPRPTATPGPTGTPSATSTPSTGTATNDVTPTASNSETVTTSPASTPTATASSTGTPGTDDPTPTVVSTSTERDEDEDDGVLDWLL